MKRLIIAMLAALVQFLGFGQTNFIKGTLDINYRTRTELDGGQPKAGVTDAYRMAINICNSSVFAGTVLHTPQLMGGLVGRTVTQRSKLEYDVDLSVLNPKDPNQQRKVGRIYGIVPINEAGVYLFSEGAPSIAINQMGTASGFDSQFGGSVIGKPLNRKPGWLDKLKQDAVTITKSVGGQTRTLVVKKWDKMEFQSLTLPAGPVQSFQKVPVVGQIFYDYDKAVWLFRGVMLGNDRVEGSIRWVESPKRKINGEGQYQFDLQVNPPLSTEQTAYTASTNDEESFFKTDTSIPSLTGTMNYKDTMSGETVISSHVDVNLTGNNITRQQTMALFKLMFLVAVVPVNAE